MSQPPRVAPSLDVSVVMPVYDARHHLESSLTALCRIDDARLVEVIVVDDGSQDGSAEFAERAGARVLSSGGRRGPGAARNVGAGEARGDVLLFVDADVVVRSDVVERVVAGFGSRDIIAVFGSYDDSPSHPGTMSQYMNLRHHHGHRIPSTDAATFWAGLGAVRRDAFMAVGGFDVERFPLPSVEDIELGHRLRVHGGRIVRDPTIQGKHLKRWTLVDVVRTDLLRRAIPWSRLMQEHPGAFDDLNVGAAERGKAVLAAVLAISTLAALAGGLTLWIPLGLAVCAGLANRSLTELFARTNGWWFAARGLLFHQLYYLYSTAAYAYGFARWRLLRAVVQGEARRPDDSPDRSRKPSR